MRTRPRSVSGIAALTATPVVLPSAFIGMPAAQPTICPPTIIEPEIGEHGEPFTAVSPPDPAGGWPGPYQNRLSSPKSISCCVSW